MDAAATFAACPDRCRGIRVGRKRVAGLIPQQVSPVWRKFVTTTITASGRQAPDLVDRNFTEKVQAAVRRRHLRPDLLLFIRQQTVIVNSTWASFAEFGIATCLHRHLNTHL
jgi:hypothetical protein